jgi:hypothetical protein
VTSEKDGFSEVFRPWTSENEGQGVAYAQLSTDGNGTSQATALASAGVSLIRSKFPDEAELTATLRRALAG